MIAGRLALTVAAIAAAGIALHDANTSQLHAVVLSYQLAAKGTVINQPDPVTAQRLAVGAWSVFPCSQIDSVMTTLLTEQQENETLLASSSGVNGVAFSPDGSLLASADADGIIQLWNPATGQPSPESGVLPAAPAGEAARSEHAYGGPTGRRCCTFLLYCLFDLFEFRF
jgi:hypothetical protein